MVVGTTAGIFAAVLAANLPYEIPKLSIYFPEFYRSEATQGRAYSEQRQNVLGNEKPETYVEVDGVKYYPHIDGKDISDLVKE